MSNSDEKLLNKFNVPNNENLKDYAMAPIHPKSLFIKNGVMYILGGVSSGKSTLLSKLMAVYTKTIQPIIICFYTGLTPDETTTYALSSFGVKPHFVKLTTPEAMMSFFNQFRFKRLKYAELLMFLLSVFKSNTALILSCVEMVNELNLNEPNEFDNTNYIKRVNILNSYISDNINNNKININKNKGFIYLSQYLLNTYSKQHKVDFDEKPSLFITNALVSFSHGFQPQTITVDSLNDLTIKPDKASFNIRFQSYTFEPFIRISKIDRNLRSESNKTKIELVPSICIFDDVASFPLLTSEHSNQWTKDLFAETRRWMNTFIIAAQRHNLLNKTLRSLTHTFFIGYSLVDDDIPRIAKEIPTNLLSSNDFKLLYNNIIKPFTFFVYNNKYGYNVLSLK